MDDEECRVLEDRTFVRDRGGYRYVGGGVAWSTNWIAGKEEKNAIAVGFEITAWRLWTSPVQHPVFRRSDDSRPVPPNAEPLDLRFINTATQEEHQHRVGYRQREPLNGWQLGITLTVGGFLGGKGE